MLPAPIIVEHEGIRVVRDDLLPGGTKRRAIHALFDVRGEYVYATPAFGYAQVALAYAARDYGKKATLFVAARKAPHPLTQEASAAGAFVHEIPHGYLSVVTARAREYADRNGACLLPFGLHAPAFIATLAAVAKVALPEEPEEVWSVIGSGALTQALQQAWPNARVCGVVVGTHAGMKLAGRAEVLIAPEEYTRPARYPPPFPSCSNYDAKAWQFIKAHARPGAVFWNVAA